MDVGFRLYLILARMVDVDPKLLDNSKSIHALMSVLHIRIYHEFMDRIDNSVSEGHCFGIT